jgi:sugar O-acyltransferase (sialic acid O-acetyltransferase NeuD family)
MGMKKLAIIGSGDLGTLIAFHARQQQYTIAGFFNDFRQAGELVDGSLILGGIDQVQDCFNKGVFDELMIGIGYKHFEIRKRLFQRFYGQVPFATIIHKDVSIAVSCTIGTGCFILPGCILDNNVRIGDNVLINVGSTIAHDSVVENHSFLSPRVAVAGFVHIGECCNLGINATIIDNITIADNVQVGGGAVVIKNLTESGVYVGNPVRFVRPHQIKDNTLK